MSEKSTVSIVGKSQLAGELQAGLESLGHLISTSQADSQADKNTDKTNTDKTKLAVWVQNMPSSETPLLKQSEKDWAKNCEAETKSAIDASRDFYEPLKANSGVLVFVIPNIGMGGAEGFAASAGASEAIRILGKGLAKLWGQDSIRVHCLALHPTHFLGAQHSATGEKLSQAMSLANPAFEGIGNAKTDIAQILDLLAQDGAGFLTGATLCADGGVWLA